MKNKVSRRDFMKGAAIVAASGVLAGCGGTPASSSSSISSKPASSVSQPASSISSKPASSSTSSSSVSSSSISSSTPEQTGGIQWTYKKTSNTTATLTGWDKTAEEVPEGEVNLPEKVISGL